ncbi:MAG: chemotaxis-specific protein-glutamate methyltransferase CheB [Candidatus Methylumidiphilus sp.]
MRIAIANAPRPAVESLRIALSRAPQHDLAWVVKSGVEAMLMCKEDIPDLLLLGLLLPVSEVVNCALGISKNSPCPILVVADNYERQISGIFDVMGAGALDVVNVPATLSEEDAIELLRKIEAIGKRTAPSLAGRNSRSVFPPKDALPLLVAIGASTGGPNAIAAILSALPKDFPAAILVVQHVDQQFADGIARWLGQNCRLPVNIARTGEKPLAGHVLLASTNDHMALTADRTIAYTAEPKEYPYRPSVDVLFESIAQHWTKPSVAVLLTGMGRDGALGLMTLLRAGWHTIAQDKESCAVYGMPKAAIELGAAKLILSPPEIAEELMAYVKSQSTRPMRG